MTAKYELKNFMEHYCMSANEIKELAEEIEEEKEREKSEKFWK